MQRRSRDDPAATNLDQVKPTASNQVVDRVPAKGQSSHSLGNRVRQLRRVAGKLYLMQARASSLLIKVLPGGASETRTRDPLLAKVVRRWTLPAPMLLEARRRFLSATASRRWRLPDRARSGHGSDAVGLGSTSDWRQPGSPNGHRCSGPASSDSGPAENSYPRR